MHVVTQEFAVYEARRGWTSYTILSTAIAGPILLVLAALFVITHIWVGLLALAFFLRGLLGIVDGGIRKPVALRMDERGITLTKNLARKPTVVVPWPELRAVWLQRQSRRINSIGVTTTSLPDKPRRTFSMVNWQVDVDRVAEILARYAPTATINNELSGPDNDSGHAPEMSGPPSTVQP